MKTFRVLFRNENRIIGTKRREIRKEKEKSASASNISRFKIGMREILSRSAAFNSLAFFLFLELFDSDSIPDKKTQTDELKE